MSNPRCLISQIAVTFDEGDRAAVNAEMGRVRGGASVYVCVVFLLMCTVQIQLCPLLLNKSFFKCELCLQQFSASRHRPLSLSLFLCLHCFCSFDTASSLICFTYCSSHAPSPTFYSWVEYAFCRMLHAQTYTDIYMRLGILEK